MKRKRNYPFRLLLIVLAIFICCFAFTPFVTNALAGSDVKVEYEMATKKAKITDFKSYIKPYLKTDVLWYEIALKNVSDTPARFVVRIFQEEGAGFTCLVPRTGKPKKFPLLAPGKESISKYPVVTSFKIPDKVTIVVEETFK